MTNIHIGDTVYLRPARVFSGYDGKFHNEPRRGPLTVENVYKHGEHWRATACDEMGLEKYDANIKSFDKE